MEKQEPTFEEKFQAIKEALSLFEGAKTETSGAATTENYKYAQIFARHDSLEEFYESQKTAQPVNKIKDPKYWLNILHNLVIENKITPSSQMTENEIKQWYSNIDQEGTIQKG